MIRATLAALSVALSMPMAVQAASLAQSPHPVARPGPVVQAVALPARFEAWIGAFERRARAAGISAATFQRAFAEVDYLPDVIRRDRSQAEFTKQIWEYLDSAVSDARLRNGRAAFAARRDTLRAIERRYGVEAEVVTAIWGLESAYGSYRGATPTLSAMATLAYEGRRAAFFEDQLIAALKILQDGDTTPGRMTGSWAGAMGHTQFMPTSYLDYAVDFTGDGRRDIWGEDPTDALASTAAYLKAFGWTTGQPWGVEVRLPAGFDYSLTGEKVKRSPADWARLGVRDMDGRAVPNHGRASILLPAGARGAAFMIFDNFHVIERYNTADAYVIAVGVLSDRIAGGQGIRADWPRGDRALSFTEKKEMQRLLGRAGFDTGKVDGIIGPNTIDAVRRYQASIGVVPDGYASLDILRRLR
ncbi:lytic murein transglycosylase [Dinoroseobacter sp. PD6]|uniref:lytic murein transglycosylase n=1 Tax=Dinoroseobacter sp. PD6 TaxID=3028384 RepID=UPI00237B94D9|nr:lytic murein transglycosylase [Dinoroseobacter sp. PD6]MDD9717161.1 lytic murein transglycosylase [Dinoroseobacter sp. PD6]